MMGRRVLILLILLLKLLLALLRKYSIQREFECVIYHPREQHLQVCVTLLHAGIRIDLNKPHLEVLIDHEVISEDLEAISAIVGVELLSHSQH